MTDINELAQRNNLLIANGYETANLLRHLSENEIDSDYFAVVSECESYGKETDAELAITDFARRAADYVSELIEALEKAQQDHRIHAARLISEKALLKERIAELESRTVSAAAADVLAERQRQMTAEGWTPDGDDRYTYAELSIAAQCYAAHSGVMGSGVPVQWPWDDAWWKPSDRRRNLIKSGALILAEIERIDRAAGIKWEAE